MFPNTPADDDAAQRFATQTKLVSWWQLAKMQDIAADMGRWPTDNSDDQ